MQMQMQMQQQQQQPSAAARDPASARAAGADADDGSDCAHLTALTIARLVAAARRAGARRQTQPHTQAQAVADGGFGEYDAAKFRADAAATMRAPAAASAGAGAAGGAADAGDAADADPVRYVLRAWLRPLLAATASQSPSAASTPTAAPPAASASVLSLSARRGGADEALCLQVRDRVTGSRARERASERASKRASE